ncbi:hypothetical protein MUK42_09352, partial [Musa troglodytarum]
MNDAFIPLPSRRKCNTLIWIQVGSKRMDMIKYRANPDIQFIIFHTTVGSLLVEKVMFKELKQLSNGMDAGHLHILSCTAEHSRLILFYNFLIP